MENPFGCFTGNMFKLTCRDAQEIKYINKNKLKG